MGAAYTPGLTISSHTTISRLRRLQIKGDVLVSVGQKVSPAEIVAHSQVPGLMQSIKLAAALGIEPADIAQVLTVKIGDRIEKDQIIAQSRSFFGMFKSDFKSPIAGVLETISTTTGSIGIRLQPNPIEINAYISGVVAEIVANEGAVIQTQGALMQGIFGIGGEKTGVIVMKAKSPDDILHHDQITDDLAGKIIVTGAGVTADAMRRAAALHVAGIVTGGIIDKDMVAYLGHDIGVAITGREHINTTIIVTEGFGVIPMAQRTFDLLASLAGQTASINGATQIRAGVIRPEIVVPNADTKITNSEDEIPELGVGSSIRFVREPYFGLLGVVSALPSQLTTVESGASVRVLEATLGDGETVVVPRANVEIIAG